MLDSQGRRIVRKNLDGVYSIKGGVVIEVGYAKSSKTGYGNYILVKDQKNGVIVRYAHLDKINVTKGQMLNKEDEIGIMGSSGTKSKHLHVSVYKDSKRDDPMKHADSDLTMDMGRQVDPLEYIRDKGVWPTNTKISGGFNEPYDFSLKKAWYTHEGVDFSGRTNPKDPNNRLITDYHCGLKGDGPYNSYKDHKDSYELYIRTRYHQKKTMDTLVEEWTNLGGKDNLEETLLNINKKIKDSEDNIIKSKERLSEIEDNITKTNESDIPFFMKQKLLKNLKEELAEAKTQFNDLKNAFEAKKKKKEDLKILAGQLDRAGSIEYARRIDKLNNAKSHRDELKKEAEKAAKENEQAQKNPKFSDKVKEMYSKYANETKAALEKAEKNISIAEGNLKKYVDGKTELNMETVVKPLRPDFNGAIKAEENKAPGSIADNSRQSDKKISYPVSNPHGPRVERPPRADKIPEKDFNPPLQPPAPQPKPKEPPSVSRPTPPAPSPKPEQAPDKPPKTGGGEKPGNGGGRGKSGGGGGRPRWPRYNEAVPLAHSDNDYYISPLVGTAVNARGIEASGTYQPSGNEINKLQNIINFNITSLQSQDITLNNTGYGRHH
ncbi:M23 family metallopeptidase [Treponema pedis]|nr:peptidoglycan DD-metalloendopeptidase family protein [Treponema pedis]